MSLRDPLIDVIVTHQDNTGRASVAVISMPTARGPARAALTLSDGRIIRSRVLIPHSEIFASSIRDDRLISRDLHDYFDPRAAAEFSLET